MKDAKQRLKEMAADDEEFSRWWITPNPALDDKTPKEIYKNDPERLERIVYFLESGEPL